jgi:hypothetical protein
MDEKKGFPHEIFEKLEQEVFKCGSLKIISIRGSHILVTLYEKRPSYEKDLNNLKKIIEDQEMSECVFIRTIKEDHGPPRREF